jgi:hypothetical protein
MLVTSTSKVALPSGSDFIFTFRYDAFHHPQVGGRQSFGFRQPNGWLDPELGLTRRTLHLNVDALLLARKEEKAKSALPEYGRAHRSVILGLPQRQCRFLA